jgi:hypothetical protein
MGYFEIAANSIPAKWRDPMRGAARGIRALKFYAVGQFLRPIAASEAI